MLWSFGDQFSLRFVQMLVSIVLARLLLPAQFGLIGMLAIFTAIADAIMDSGFGSALIQKKHLTREDTSSIFFFNLFVGIILAGLLSLAAPLIANFYKQPILVPITRILSLNLIINAFALVQTSLLTKRMEFKLQFKINLSAAILSGAIAVFMAYRGFGVWSLVALLVTANLFRAIFLWAFNNWRPQAVFSFKSLETMFPFGSKLLFSQLISRIGDNSFQVVIGRMFTVSDLGYYNRASSFGKIVTDFFGSSIGKVSFPALAPLQDDVVVLKRAYRKAIKLSTFVHFPLMIGVMAAADALIRLLLTEKWAPSIPYFQLMCVVGLPYPLHVLNLNLLKVKGRSDLFLRLEIIKQLSVIPAIALTYQWGITGLLYGQIAISFLAYFLNSYYSRQLIGYREIDQMKDVFPFLLRSLLMGAAMIQVGLIQNQNLFVVLLLQFITGVFVYFLINFLAKSPELFEIIEILTKIVSEYITKHKMPV